ncbi:MAG: hypothetical protein U0841_06550 [Chloroflexia bacterium]
MLHAAGFVAGDVLVTTAPITDDVLITCLACCRLDLVFCHLSPQYTAAEVGHLAARAGARATLTVDGAAHPGSDLPSLPLALPGPDTDQAAADELPQGNRRKRPPSWRRPPAPPPRCRSWRSCRTEPTPGGSVRTTGWRTGPRATCSTTKSFNSLLRQFCVSVVNGNAHLISHFPGPGAVGARAGRVSRRAADHPAAAPATARSQPAAAVARPATRVIRVGAAPLTPELAAAARQRFSVPVVPSYASTESQATIVM